MTFKIEDLTVYRQGQEIIQNLSFSFPPGALIAVVGPNGGGKSTLLDTLHGFNSCYQGSFDRGPFTSALTAYLPQKSEMNRSFPLKVQNVVAQGLWHELGAFQPMKDHHFSQIYKALEAVGLKGFATQPIEHLSGGQFQRTLFARLMVQKASLLLLDEPFNGIDASTQDDLLNLIQVWHQEGQTFLVVLHNIELVKRFFPYTLLLARHYHIFGKTQDVITPENLKTAYHYAGQWATDFLR